MATQAQVSAARYVAVPFRAEIVDASGWRRSIIQCQQEGVDADFSQYHKFTTHAGFPIEWAEVPVTDLEATDFVNWFFASEISGTISFAGTGAQAVNFFRSLKKQWLPELTPEDVFVASF